MTDATAAFYDIPTFSGRVLPAGLGRRVLKGVAVGAVAIIATGAIAATVAVGGAWIISATLATSPYLHAPMPMGPARLTLGRTVQQLERTAELAGPVAGSTHIAHGPESNSVSKWADAFALPAARAVTPQPAAPKARVAQAIRIPLPRPHPAQMVAARAPVVEPAPPAVSQAAPKALPQVAMLTPPPAPAEKRIAPQPAHNNSLALPEPGSRTAIYDISARTVFMPNGQKLEAHSGLGDKRDDPRYVKVRMRGPTPPNVYDLTLREKLFHGVRAIRLNPVDEGKMHGRDGMLAHTYMLGPNGQSNGCVSFKDYQKFLTAFMNGEVDRLVVVPDRSDTSWRGVLARLGPARNQPPRRYAANSEPANYSPVERSFTTW